MCRICDRVLLFLKKNKKMTKFCDPNGWKLCSKWMKYILSSRSQVWFSFRGRIRVSVTYKFHCYLQWILTLTFILPGPGDRWFENMVCFYSFFFSIFFTTFLCGHLLQKSAAKSMNFTCWKSYFSHGFFNFTTNCVRPVVSCVVKKAKKVRP